ncbi:hypothetical protein [Meiothermus sp. QL-1]|nr:hypothetical protein [Meiothermus sp. QL-1]
MRGFLALLLLWPFPLGRGLVVEGDLVYALEVPPGGEARSFLRLRNAS